MSLAEEVAKLEESQPRLNYDLLDFDMIIQMMHVWMRRMDQTQECNEAELYLARTEYANCLQAIARAQTAFAATPEGVQRIRIRRKTPEQTTATFLSVIGRERVNELQEQIKATLDMSSIGLLDRSFILTSVNELVEYLTGGFTTP